MSTEQTEQPSTPTLTIDGVEYAVDSLSNNAKQLIGTLRVADREIGHLEAQMTLMRIARQTVANSLKSALETPAVA